MGGLPEQSDRCYFEVFIKKLIDTWLGLCNEQKIMDSVEKNKEGIRATELRSQLTEHLKYLCIKACSRLAATFHYFDNQHLFGVRLI